MDYLLKNSDEIKLQLNNNNDSIISYQINEGWNLIGWQEDVNFSEIDLSDSIVEIRNLEKSFNKNTPIFFNTLDKLEKGKGYWVKSETTFEWNIESNVSYLNFKKVHDVFTITASYRQLTHYDNTLKTSNAFLYHLNDKKYLITTAHLLFDSWKSVDSERPSLIKSMKQVLNKYWYSRFFDVAVFDVTDIDKFKSMNSIKDSTTDIPEDVHVSYMDPGTGNIIRVDSKYTNIISSHIMMGAFGHKLNGGSSGSAVINNNGSLVGMITSCSENYNNTTLVIPTTTIMNIIATGSINKPNYDSNNMIYPGIISQPLARGHMEFININNGECVVYSENNKLQPFDIITHVNNIPIGKDNRLSNISLEKKESLKLSLYKIKMEWRNIYGSLPRHVFYESFSNEHHVLMNEVINSNFTINNNEIIFYKNLPDKLVHIGMLLKIYYFDNSFKFVSVVEIKKNIIIVDININKYIKYDNDYSENYDSSNKDKNGDIINISFLPLSCIYNENANNNTIGTEDYLRTFPSEKFCENIIEYSEFNIKSGELIDKQYKKLCIYAVLKNWTFLICSNIKHLSKGYQQIIWAKEINIMLSKINYNLEVEDIINVIFFKLLEFQGIYAMNLFNILIQICSDKYELNFNIIKSIVKSFKKFFPIIDNTNTLSSSINIFGKKFNYSGITPPLGSIAKSKNNTKLFQVIDMIEDKELVVRLFTPKIEHGDKFIIEDNEYTINSEPIDTLLFDNLNGDSTFSAEGYSSENFHLKDRISKAKATGSSFDNVNTEIELTLKELEYLSKWDGSGLYYPRYFGMLKSYWDHGYLPYGGIMETLNDDSFIKEETTISLKNLPDYLSTWNYDTTFQFGGGGFGGALMTTGSFTMMASSGGY